MDEWYRVDFRIVPSGEEKVFLEGNGSYPEVEVENGLIPRRSVIADGKPGPDFKILGAQDREINDGAGRPLHIRTFLIQERPSAMPKGPVSFESYDS